MLRCSTAVVWLLHSMATLLVSRTQTHFYLFVVMKSCHEVCWSLLLPCQDATVTEFQSFTGYTLASQDAYDWKSARAILDVGGGRGELLSSAMSWAGDSCKGLLLDRQPVIARYVGKAGLGSVCIAVHRSDGCSWLPCQDSVWVCFGSGWARVSCGTMSWAGQQCD